MSGLRRSRSRSRSPAPASASAAASDKKSTRKASRSRSRSRTRNSVKAKKKEPKKEQASGTPKRRPHIVKQANKIIIAACQGTPNLLKTNGNCIFVAICRDWKLTLPQAREIIRQLRSSSTDDKPWIQNGQLWVPFNYRIDERYRNTGNVGKYTPLVRAQELGCDVMVKALNEVFDAADDEDNETDESDQDDEKYDDGEDTRIEDFHDRDQPFFVGDCPKKYVARLTRHVLKDRNKNASIWRTREAAFHVLNKIGAVQSSFSLLYNPVTSVDVTPPVTALSSAIGGDLGGIQGLVSTVRLYLEPVMPPSIMYDTWGWPPSMILPDGKQEANQEAPVVIRRVTAKEPTNIAFAFLTVNIPNRRQEIYATPYLLPEAPAF